MIFFTVCLSEQDLVILRYCKQMYVSMMGHDKLDGHTGLNYITLANHPVLSFLSTYCLSGSACLLLSL